MRNLKPAFSRSLSRSIEALFWTSLVGILSIGLILLIPLVDRLEHPRHALPAEHVYAIGGVMAGVFGVLGVVLALQGFFSTLGVRYEIGATELTIRSGNLWRRTTMIPLVGITRIDTIRGPLMRISGLSDLRIYTATPGVSTNGAREWPAVTLLGLKDAEELRRYLLERRDTLHESALRGDLSVARTPQELLTERLASALERLDRRLPKA